MPAVQMTGALSLVANPAAVEPAPAPLPERKPAKATADSPVSILISRQTGRIYIRQNFEPLYEGEIAIKDPDLPLGTHLVTAIGYNEDRSALRWNVVTFEREGQKVAEAKPRGRMSDADRADAAAGIRRTWLTPPGAAIDRIEFNEEMLDLLTEAAKPGMSMIITDRGLGPETGKGTEFVIQPK